MTEQGERRIVVGVDGSPASIEALRWAARMGGAIGAPIDAVIASDVPSSWYGYSWEADAIRPADDATRGLEDAVAHAFGDTKPDGLRMIVRSGHNPAKILLDASRDAEMLVVGCRGRSPVASFLLGSVSTDCAEHADCPVVVVHSDDSGI